MGRGVGGGDYQIAQQVRRRRDFFLKKGYECVPSTCPIRDGSDQRD